MRTNTEGLLNKLPTVTACLCGIAGVHSHDLMTSSCSLLFKNVEECAPTGIQNGFRQVMVLDHIRDGKVLNRNALVAESIGLSCLEVMVSTLAVDLQVRLGDITRCLAETVAFLLASGELALLASQSLLRGAIEAWISNGVPFTIRQEGLETHIDADIRMRASTWEVFILWLSLTDDERVPVTVRTQNKMYCLRGSHDLAVQLDLERLAYLSRHDEMLLVLMQIDIFAVLPQLDGVPPVRFLEAGEAALLTQFFHGKEAFQSFGEPVSQHLYRGGWYVFFALPLELCFQFVLVRKSTRFFIFLLGYRTHLIIDTTRLSQTGDKFGMLSLIDEKAILKGSHERILLQPTRNVNKRVLACGRRVSPPCMNAGALTRR